MTAYIYNVIAAIALMSMSIRVGTMGIGALKDVCSVHKRPLVKLTSMLSAMAMVIASVWCIVQSLILVL